MKVKYELKFEPDLRCAKDAALVIETALESARKVLKRMSDKNNLSWNKHIVASTKPIPDETTS